MGLALATEYSRRMRTPRNIGLGSPLGAPVAEAVERAILTAGAKEKLWPSRFEVRVIHTDQPAFNGLQIDLALPDAIKLLARPFRIVVEDDDSDRAFLLAFCSDEQRGSQVERERDGYLEFRHGGGIDWIKVRADQLAQDPTAPYLHFILFDSDSLSPGNPSRASGLRRACASIPCDQLARRFMESYLPIQALTRWTFESRRTRPIRKPLFNAFCSLSDDQRHHYGMKHGFNGDAKRKANGENDNGLYLALASQANCASSWFSGGGLETCLRNPTQ